MSSTPNIPSNLHREQLKKSINEALQTITQIDLMQKALAEDVKEACGWHRRDRTYPPREFLDKIKSLRDTKIWPLLDSCSEAVDVVNGVQAILDLLTGRAEPPESDPHSETGRETKQLPGRRCKYKNYQASLDALWTKVKHAEIEVRISESLCNARLNQVL